MTEPLLGLSPAELSRAFPFHFAFGRDLRVVQSGPTLSRMIAPTVGARADELFEVVRPDVALRFDDIRASTGLLFILRTRGSAITLRGQMMEAAGGEALLFLGSLWAEDAETLLSRGLTLGDFALHDATLDLLQALQSTRMSLAEAQRLASKLGRKGSELRRANEALRGEIEERAQAEAALRARQALLEEQQEIIRNLRVPVMRIWQGALAVPIVGLLDAQRLGALAETLLARIVAEQIDQVLFDLTGVEHVDLTTAEGLLRVVRAAGLLGARCALTGIQQDLAAVLVSLDVDLSSFSTYGTLEAGLRAMLRAEALAAPAPSGRTGV